MKLTPIAPLAAVEMDEENRKAIADAVKREIQRVLASTETLTHQELRVIERLVSQSRELLTTGLPERADMGSGPYVSYGSGDGMPIQMPLSQGNPSENYGATVIRELVAALPRVLDRGPTVTELVTAAAEARKLGQDGLAEQLETEIAHRLTRQPEEPKTNGAAEEASL